MKTNQHNRADIIAVLGASGTGKSTYVKKHIGRPKDGRLLIFDVMHEYGSFGQVFTRSGELVTAIMQAGEKGKFRYVFQPSTNPAARGAQFDLLCGVAHAAGNLSFIAEELRFVTTPSRAPVRWAGVSLTGRHKGLSVIGTSQRPASIDKDFLGNATIIRTGRLVYPQDVKAVATVMQIDPAEIAALPDLHFIEKNMQTGQINRGVVKP